MEHKRDARSSGGGGLPTTRMSVLRGLGGSGDAAGSAWFTFMSVYGPIAYRFAIRARLPAQEAEEVVANVMRNLLTWFRNGSVVDHSRGRFRHFFRKVVNHEISAARQRRRGDLNLDQISEQGIPDPPSALEDAEQREILRLVLDRLRAMPSTRPRDMLVFERYVLGGESPNQLSREFGISRSRVYAIKHEFTRELRALCEQADDELAGGIG